MEKPETGINKFKYGKKAGSDVKAKTATQITCNDSIAC